MGRGFQTKSKSKKCTCWLNGCYHSTDKGLHCTKMKKEILNCIEKYRVLRTYWTTLVPLRHAFELIRFWWLWPRFHGCDISRLYYKMFQDIFSENGSMYVSVCMGMISFFVQWILLCSHSWTKVTSVFSIIFNSFQQFLSVVINSIG